MEITEVRIKLMENPEDRLRGFCSVTFDNAFVIRDLKIIEGNNGPFVAMPSRKLTSNCRKCRCKNHLKANYCNQCGAKVQRDRLVHDSSGRAKLYADIAHPINAQCREMIQSRIVEELQREQKLSQEPGYRSRYDEGYDDARHIPKPHKHHGAAVSAASLNQSETHSQHNDEALASEKVSEKSQQQAGSKESKRENTGDSSGTPMAASSWETHNEHNSSSFVDRSKPDNALGAAEKTPPEVAGNKEPFGNGIFDI